MQKLFNKILIPVDFSTGSKVAVEKAVEIARQYRCSIHLLYVHPHAFAVMPVANGSYRALTEMIDNKKEIDTQFEKICRYIAEISKSTITAECSMVNGSWNYAIVDFITANNIDLVLIGEQATLLGKKELLANPDFIAEKANVPVITVPPGRHLNKLYCIVIPVTDFLPVKKLVYGIYMAYNLDCTIKLLGIENAATERKMQHYLAKAADLIKDNCNVKVETETMVSTNVADAVNKFAISEAADLIIVNPGTQTKMPGLFSTLLNKVIQKYSLPPVLTVNPVYHY